MLSYEEVMTTASEIFGVKGRPLDAAYLTAVLSGNPDTHNEVALKIIAIGHEHGGRINGRGRDSNGRIQFHPSELDAIGKDYMIVHVQAMSLAFSILSQTSIQHMEEVSRQCVCILFDIGYKIGSSEMPEGEPFDPEKHKRNLMQKANPKQERSSFGVANYRDNMRNKENEDSEDDVPLDSDMTDFLNRLLGDN